MTDRLGEMLAAMVHRGPDGEGRWFDDDAGVALGHRRLSIIDLTENGTQPALSPSGRYVITYNGEIYNYEALADELAPHFEHAENFSSDTRVLLAAIEHWGLEEAVRRSAGMFAFALYDRTERRLHLVRDRIGIKPLYYSLAGGCISFASGLKALALLPEISRDVAPQAIAQYLQLGYLQAPATIYRDVCQLEPGCMLSVDIGGGGLRDAPVRYWEPDDPARQTENAGMGHTDAVDAVDAVLDDAVRLCLVSDVPVGVLLSGGIDSSTVLAMATKHSSQRVRSFCVGFDHEDFDESAHARKVADYFGAEHTEYKFSEQDVLDLVPSISSVYDEPFADTSQLPTMLLCARVRENVTVGLSGDGGDELFAGYSHYFTTRKLLGVHGKVPGALRKLLSCGIRNVPPAALAAAGRTLHATGLSRGDTVSAEQLYMLSDLLKADDERTLYRRKFSYWAEPWRVVSRDIAGGYDEYVGADGAARDYLDWMMKTDLDSYLPNDVLVKTDRASMAVSLEARVPVLDHRVIETARSLPLALQTDGKGGKAVLRAVLGRYIPPEFYERRKMGFGIPLAGWLRGPLRDWAETHLSEDVLRRHGLVKAAPVRRMWEAHLAGNVDFSLPLWAVVVLHNWVEAR